MDRMSSLKPSGLAPGSGQMQTSFSFFAEINSLRFFIIFFIIHIIFDNDM